MNNDIKLFFRPSYTVLPQVEQEFSSVMSSSKEKSCVVVGDADFNFSFENMNAAFNALLTMKDPTLFCLGKGSVSYLPIIA